MRNILLAAIFAMSSMVAEPARASEVATNATNATNAPVLNCDALNKGTMICVRNYTGKTITKITCTGFWGITPMSIPQGIIKANGTTIIDFGADKCAKQITVTTRDGQTYPFVGFDTTSNTVLIVDSVD